MKIAVFAVIALLTGCATCQQHPVGCVAASVFVAGAIAASQSAGHDNNATHSTSLLAHIN